MPSRNEIVPMDAPVTPERPDVDARPGPGAVTLPHKETETPFGKAKATNSEMASAQEQRVALVRAQRRYTAYQLFYAVFGVMLMMVQMEYLWFTNTQELPDTCPVDSVTKCPLCFEALATSVPVSKGRMILLALRVLIMFSTALMLYYIYTFYAAECEIMKLKNIMPPKATLLSSSLRPALLLEMAVLGVHPFPGIESVDPKWPQLAVATSLLMFVRVGLIIRVVQFRNSFNTSNGWFIGALTNVDFTTTFFMKSTLKNHPTSCLMASFAILGFVAGYSLYVAERFLCAFKGDSCCQPMLLGDALWMLIITILTIGYGDVVPRTTLGRAIAVCAGIFGTLSTAVTIAVMSNYLVLTRSEHKVNAFLKKDENRRVINDHAARALQAFVQLRAAQRRHNQAVTGASEFEVASGSASVANAESTAETTGKPTLGIGSKRAVRRAELKLFTVLSKYRQVKRRVHSHDVSDPMDSQMTMLEMMEVNVEYIRTKIEELSELFLAQTGDRSHSKRKLSNLMAAASALGPTMNTAAVNSGGSLSLPPSNSGSISLMQQQHQHPQRSLHRQQPSYPLRQQAPAMTALQESEQSVTSTTNTPRTSYVTQPSMQESEMTPCTSFQNQEVSAIAQENIPTWALVLELSLQSLLEQVARVSDEVETMKVRMQAQSEAVESRVTDLEKRIVVSDALHEMSMTRGSSARNLLRRGSNSSGDGSTAGSSPGLPRPRRTSTVHRPSIHNFVSPRDLLEYQKSDDQDEQGEG